MMYEINSLVTFKRADKLEEKPSEILINNEDMDAFNLFFQSRSEFKGLRILSIKISNGPISLISIQSKLISFIKNGLEQLVIEADSISNAEFFLENVVNFYSSLGRIEVKAKKYVDTQGSEEPLLSDKVIKLSEKIIEQNEEIKQFLESGYAEKINDLNILDPYNLDLQELTEEQLRYLWDLGEKHHRLSDYRNLHKKLAENENFKKLFILSGQYNVECMIPRNQLKDLKIFYSKLHFDLNNHFSLEQNQYCNQFMRLVDWAVNHRTPNILSWLIKEGAELTHSYSTQTEIAFPHDLSKRQSSWDRERNFPLMTAWKSNRQDNRLKELLLNQDSAVYDALGWCICYGEKRTFDEICSEYNALFSSASNYNLRKQKGLEGKKKIEFSKIISTGKFSEFSLLQLMIYYSRTEWFLDVTLSFSEEQRRVILESKFPEIGQFRYSSWTVLEVIAFQGLYNELEVLCKNMNSPFHLKNEKQHGPLKLVLQGASKIRYSKEIREQHHKKIRKLNPFKKCLEYLIHHNLANETLDGLTFDDKKIGEKAPLLFFVIYYSLWQIVSGKISLSKELLEQRYLVKDHEVGLNPLQWVIIYFRNDPYKKDILQFIVDSVSRYREENLLKSSISEPISSLDDMNLFQYAVLHHPNNELIETMIDWEECPINTPYPDSHSSYPGWLPIHVAMIKEFYNRNALLPLLLKRKEINISRPFPSRGVPNRLSRLYPLSVVFYDGSSPLINSRREFSYRLSSYFEIILKRVKTIKDSGKRKEILDQALLQAVLNYKPERLGLENKIQLLLDNGADPDKNISTGGRVLDLARDKGLLAPFREWLSDQPIFLSGCPKIIPNLRISELSECTSHDCRVDDNYAVVSLVRNKMSKSPVHVFLVIEYIERGLSKMHFADFIQDLDPENRKKSLGKIRIDREHSGRLNDSLIYNCTKKLMEIENLDDLIVDQWQITMHAFDALQKSIEAEEKKETLIYSSVGNQSFFTSSSGKGDNCYTWVRRQLLASGDPAIKRCLSPSFGEWIASLPLEPRRKEKRPITYTAYIQSFFTQKNLQRGLVGGALVLVAAGGYCVSSLTKQ